MHTQQIPQLLSRLSHGHVIIVALASKKAGNGKAALSQSLAYSLEKAAADGQPGDGTNGQ